ncbi:MAG: TIGR04348 family glycosyltransferase [Actinobacteria bacterium]|nr:TIGR04348 family glycosyltransferase [Actinomycetota bacterium]
MRIRLVTPAAAGARTGNGVTARRWTGILRDLGHRIVVEQVYEGGPGDMLVALHARRSAASIDRFGGDHPGAPVVLALTGTDVYRDIHVDASAQRSLELASCFVVLQRLAVEQLPGRLRGRCHVIYQSAVAPPGSFTPQRGRFDVALLAHLRPVKDPFLAAEATRLLPPDSVVRLRHAGAALEPEMEQRARSEMESNRRYQWLGDLPRWKALRLLARCRLLVVTSVAEGGANVVSEALACAVPVVSTDIPGSVGILGPDYPGYFPVGDAKALAELLERAAADDTFYGRLEAMCHSLQPLVAPARERESWRALLQSL